MSLSSQLRWMWRGWKTRYRDQRHELKALHDALKVRGGVALDIGCNKGSYLYWLARWSQGARVIAFEPQKKLCDYLRERCAESGLKHVTVEHLALSDQSGETSLFIPGDSDSPGASLEKSINDKTACHTEQVRMMRLDDYAAQEKLHTVRAMKIDVEGHELAVLRGAQQVILRDKPTLVIESENRHLSDGKRVEDLITLVEGWGYVASFVHPAQGELPVARFDASVHQRQQGERFWDAPGYCNNFIFRPKP